MTNTMHQVGPAAMEVVLVAIATISTRLFCLSVELRTKHNTWWVPLLPALLASLLHATVIRPLAVAARHCLKLQDTSTCSTWLRLLSKVMNQVLRILLSEQTSLWLLYLLAPHMFDINVKLKVQVRTIGAMLGLLLKNTARLLLRLVTGIRLHGSTASTDEDAAAAATDRDATDRRRQQPGVKEREDGPRRSARHRRPSVRVAGPEWDRRLRG